MTAPTTTNFVPIVTPETLPEDPVTFRCCVCEDTVLAEKIDTHAKGHKTPTMRVFRNERAYEVWLAAEESEIREAAVAGA